MSVEESNEINDRAVIKEGSNKSIDYDVQKQNLSDDSKYYNSSNSNVQVAANASVGASGPSPTITTRETSPQGRYVKLDYRLGSGAYKDVWRAYDTNEGIEVAWNVVKLSRVPPNERKRIKTEVKLLRDIEHKNVIKYYNSWVDRDKEQIIFITEIMSSGSLKDYLRKNSIIRWNALKRWCRQILRGLEFLHANHIIHRDIKCDNIFINGTTGDLRIGDLGLSTRIAEERALNITNSTGGETTNYSNSSDLHNITTTTMTCLGTPEFMAPELYEESYNEKVDIYAFGMTMIEMVTGLMPYHNCTSAAQIYKKVLRGDLPPELELISNNRAKLFVESCLQKQQIRPSAKELLSNDFLIPNEEEDYDEVRVKLDTRTANVYNKDETEETDDYNEGITRVFSNHTHFDNISDLSNNTYPNNTEKPPQVHNSIPESNLLVLSPKSSKNTSPFLQPLSNNTKIESSEMANLTITPDMVSSSRTNVRLKFHSGTKSSSNIYVTPYLIDSSKVLDENISPQQEDESNKIQKNQTNIKVNSNILLSDVLCHADDPNILVFYLRITPVGSNSVPQVDIEFDFDLLGDDKDIIAEEMVAYISKEYPFNIVKETILELFKPFILAVQKVLTQSSYADNKLSKAVLHEVVQNNDVMTLSSYNVFLTNIKKRENVTEKISTSDVLVGQNSNMSSSEVIKNGEETVIKVSSNNKLIEENMSHSNEVKVLLQNKKSSSASNFNVNNNVNIIGSKSVDNIESGNVDNFIESESEYDIENDDEYKEIIAYYQANVARIEKEYQQRLATIQTQREKFEENHRKKKEDLLTRKDDLNKQLTAMQTKYKERMREIEERKKQIENSLKSLTDKVTVSDNQSKAVIDGSNSYDNTESPLQSNSQD